MEATTTRELSGEKASRIVDAMRSSVARRGISGSTFEHVSREAGVSRGLLHYYFGTKERLLGEVVHRDCDVRIERLDAALSVAGSTEDVIEVLVANLQDSVENEPEFWVLIFELFTAGRRNPDIRREVAELFTRVRDHVTDVFKAKESEGVLKLSHDAEAVVACLFALADGIALQMLSDPDRDHSATLAAGIDAARGLLGAE